MAHAYPALPRLELDGKRIAGTTLVIALHAGVLMMLMTPVQMDSRVALPDEEIAWIVPETIYEPPPLPPPLPTERRPQPVTTTQVTVSDPVVEPVDQSFNPIDVIADPAPVDDAATSFDTGPVAPSFAQLTADVAPAPGYPMQALKRRIEGTVMLRIRVDATGAPLEVSVENSSGSSILDQAAQKFVKARWHFVPATRDGVAVESWALVPIEFVLQ